MLVFQASSVVPKNDAVPLVQSVLPLQPTLRDVCARLLHMAQGNPSLVSGARDIVLGLIDVCAFLFNHVLLRRSDGGLGTSGLRYFRKGPRFVLMNHILNIGVH